MDFIGNFFGEGFLSAATDHRKKIITSIEGIEQLTAPSFTGAPGGVLTLVPAVFSGADSQVDDWLVDGSPVTGATIDSSLYAGSVIQPRSTASKAGESDLVALGTGASIPNGMALGVGLVGINHYNGAVPFSNLMWAASSWNRTSGSGGFTDDRGYLTAEVETDTFEIIIAIGSPHNIAIPEGTCTVLNPGGAELSIKRVGETPQTSAWTTATEFTFEHTHNTTLLVVNARGSVTEPIRVIMPGQLSAWNAGDPFNPQFISYLTGAGGNALRAMDWFNANGNRHSEWAERTLDSDIRFDRRIVPYEIFIKLCNTLSRDAWICVPARASDDYIDQLGIFLAAELDPGLSVWAENGNEIWNTGGAFYDNWTWYYYYDFTRFTASVTTTADIFYLPSHGLGHGDVINCYDTLGGAGYPLGGGAGNTVEYIDEDNFRLRFGSLDGSIRSAAIGTPILFTWQQEPGKSSHNYRSHGEQSLNIWTRLDAALGRSRVNHVLGMQNVNITSATEGMSGAGVEEATDYLAGALYGRANMWHCKVDIASGQITPSAWAGSPGGVSASSVVFGVYASGSTPTPAEIMAGSGAGFVAGGAVDLPGNYAQYTAGSPITGLADDTEYEVFAAYTAKNGWTAVATESFTASATPSSFRFAETFDQTASRMQDYLNGWVPKFSNVAALGKPLIQYEYNFDLFFEGGNNGQGPGDAEFNAYKQSVLESDAYVQVFKDMNYSLAALGVVQAMVFVDSANNSGFAISDNYTDTADPRYQLFASFGGHVAKRDPIEISNILADEIEFEPTYPHSLAVLGSDALTYRIVGGNDNEWFAISDNELFLLEQNTIDFDDPLAHAVYIEATDGFTSSTFAVEFSTGYAWYQVDALFAFDSIEDSDPTEINPIIGGVLPLTHGTGAAISGGLWDMSGGNRYRSTDVLTDNPDRNKATLCAWVFNANGDTGTGAHGQLLGSPQTLQLLWLGSEDIGARWLGTSYPSFSFFEGENASGTHVLWVYIEAVDENGDTVLHAGVDLVENETAATAVNMIQDPGRTVIFGNETVSNVQLGSAQVVNREGMTLADVGPIVQKMMLHHGIGGGGGGSGAGNILREDGSALLREDDSSIVREG